MERQPDTAEPPTHAKRGNESPELDRSPKLPRTGSCDSLTQMSMDTNTPTSLPTPTSMPPIIIDQIKGWSAHASYMSQLVGGDFQASCNGKKFTIKTTSPTHYRALQKYLTEQKISFYSFTMKKSKPLKVVFRGLPEDTEPIELHDALTNIKFSVGNIHKLKLHGKLLGLWVVTLNPDEEHEAPTTRPNKDIYLLEKLMFVKVSVTPYKSTGPSQCFNCQDRRRTEEDHQGEEDEPTYASAVRRKRPARNPANRLPRPKPARPCVPTAPEQRKPAPDVSVAVPQPADRPTRPPTGPSGSSQPAVFAWPKQNFGQSENGLFQGHQVQPQAIIGQDLSHGTKLNSTASPDLSPISSESTARGNGETSSTL